MRPNFGPRRAQYRETGRPREANNRRVVPANASVFAELPPPVDVSLAVGCKHSHSWTPCTPPPRGAVLGGQTRCTPSATRSFAICGDAGEVGPGNPRPPLPACRDDFVISPLMRVRHPHLGCLRRCWEGGPATAPRPACRDDFPQDLVAQLRPRSNALVGGGQRRANRRAPRPSSGAISVTVTAGAPAFDYSNRVVRMSAAAITAACRHRRRSCLRPVRPSCPRLRPRQRPRRPPRFHRRRRPPAPPPRRH